MYQLSPLYNSQNILLGEVDKPRIVLGRLGGGNNRLKVDCGIPGSEIYISK